MERKALQRQTKYAMEGRYEQNGVELDASDIESKEMAEIERDLHKHNVVVELDANVTEPTEAVETEED